MQFQYCYDILFSMKSQVFFIRGQIARNCLFVHRGKYFAPDERTVVMLKVAKFGGSSMADAVQFAKVQAIVESDDARRLSLIHI